MEHGAGTLKGPGRLVSFPQRLDDEPVTELEKNQEWESQGGAAAAAAADCYWFTGVGQETVDNRGGNIL